MNKLLNKAIRPLAALTAVGALAAVAAFALLAMPGSQPAPAEAARQGSSAVEVTATRTSVTMAVTAAELDAADILFIAIPAYRALGTRMETVTVDGAQVTRPDARRACTVAVNEGDNNRVGGTPEGSEYGCRTNDAGDGIIAWAQVVSVTALETYEVVVTDVAPINAAPSNRELTLRENSDSDDDTSTAFIDYGTFLPDAADDTNLVEIGYNIAAIPTPETGIAFRASGNAADTVSVSSTTASAGIQIQATIQELDMDLASGSSIVLYLEHDYVVPDSFESRFAWFTVSGLPATGKVNVTNTGRHYVTDPIQFDTSDYLGDSGNGDTSIRLYLPDMKPGDNVDSTNPANTSQGYQGPVAGQTLTVSISKQAGIKNPSEEGKHHIAYSVQGPNDANVFDTPDADLSTDLPTWAKISLSDNDDARGKEVTVTGSGFNNGFDANLRVKHYASAGAYVAASGGNRPTIGASNEPYAGTADAGTIAAFAAYNGGAGIYPDVQLNDALTEEQTCLDILLTGTELGSDEQDKTVGVDDRVAINFEVANPPFMPGRNNLLCMSDGENRRSSTDVEFFKLDSSITVTPSEVSAGEQVTIQALDYTPRAQFRWLQVLGQNTPTSSDGNIGSNGKGSVTFDMPGNLKGKVKVEVCYGGSGDNPAENCKKESATIDVSPSDLTLSKTLVRPNESIIIRGSGFNKSSTTTLTSAQIGDVEMKVVSDGGELANVDVSSSGQFAATFAIWPDSGDSNPTLNGGKLEIEITDSAGFTGSAEVTILRPTLTVTPDVAGPRDYVVISGANWPVENPDGGDIRQVDVNISGSGFNDDDENEDPDANGNWTIRYRVPGTVDIPSTVNVKATYGASQDISELGKFQVPQANLEISPATVVPGGDLTLNASGFSLFVTDITVKIGNSDAHVPTGTSTDREGAIKDLTVKVPSLDAGTYTVQLQVGGDGGTVAIGDVIILADDEGGESPLPAALDPLGDNLVRVFHFNNATKTWSFYDPRPEFTELNTLSALAAGEPYWILVDQDQSVTLNARAHEMTCQGGDCWNSLVW